MNKTESEMVALVKRKRDRRLGHTKVTVMPEGVAVSYRGNHIATVTDTEIRVKDCGWRTQTTKRRLNAMLRIWTDTFIFQNRGVWYWYDNGKCTEWTGNAVAKRVERNW